MLGGNSILTAAGDSPLLQALLDSLPAIRKRLLEAPAWSGWRVRDPGSSSSYLRLVCRDELVLEHHTLVVGAHLFEQVGTRGHLHDHRWPLAVMPFAIGGGHELPLYAMPWRLHDACGSQAGGTMLVRHGRPWAIEACASVLHAVHSQRCHGSINITDIRRAPSRESRTESTPLTALQAEQLRHTVAEHLAAL